jgi:hypothetical protein
MGYSNTTKVVLYWDPTTNKIKRTAHHCFLDEFNTRVLSEQKHNQGALLLAENATGQVNPTPIQPADVHYRVYKFDIAKSAFPADECQTYQVTIPPQGHRFI